MTLYQGNDQFVVTFCHIVLFNLTGVLSPDEFRTFTCREVHVARYVAIQLSGKRYLTLCEVEVYGGKFPMVSLRCMDVSFLW